MSFLVVFDVDSTLIDQEAIELLATHSGTREQVALITERAMKGEIDFSASLIERVALLAGLDQSVLTKVADELSPTKGAVELIEAIHSAGGYVAAVSGGFIQLLEPLKKTLNLYFAKANTLEVVDGKLSGKVIGELVDSSVKAETLLALVKKLEIDIAQTIAIGDGANDLKMMKEAGLSIAFCAQPIVRESADIVIDARDLSQVIALLPN